MNLAELKVGGSGRVARVSAPAAVRRRLMDMGLLAGEVVRLEKVAPLGDPLEVALRGYRLSLRKSEAAGVELEPAS